MSISYRPKLSGGAFKMTLLARISGIADFLN